MPARLPSSRSVLRVKWSVFDIAWAALAPYLALALRDAYILSVDGMQAVLFYWLLTFTFSLFAFAAFRLRDGMAHYFSVHDAVEIAKAVAVAELLTCFVLFNVTRLDGIPRSTPIIHALILSLGLVAVRALARFSANGKMGWGEWEIARKHVIMIGVSRLTALYMKFLDAIAPGAHEIIAVLDDAADSWGRSVNGVRVMGPASELESIIEEFAVHGVQTDRVVAGVSPADLPEPVLEEIRHICARHDIELGFVPDLFGLTLSPEPESKSNAAAEFEASLTLEPALTLPSYFKAKRYLDFAAALALLTVLGPFWLIATAIALFDVGMPVFFWQQRLGVNGSRFLLYKFRTLRTPFGEDGRKLTDDERLSPIGRFMRRSRLDELPQLLNILVGDMSLVGPRPLLPRDQPENIEIRLMVRPGITGWAQVNGGVLLSPDEKERLDEWYIRNASLWLDLRIAVMTALMFFRGDRRTPHVEQTAWTSILQINEPQPRRVAVHRPFAPARLATPSKEPAVPAAAILSLRSGPSFGRRDGL
jgi:lipopolysaccharide/colanic/teichoic acid biosynthesis glycosyltransferase